MADSIFPDIVTAGGVVIRDVNGIPVAQPEVKNAYAPPATFVATCDMTALPNNCDARIDPQQINAIVSELVALAECFDPDGPWNCGSLTNLCAAFQAWMMVHFYGVLVGDTPPPNPVDNQLWWESDTGFLFLYYADANSKQWVQITNRTVVDNISITGTGVPGDPHKVALVDCGSY